MTTSFQSAGALLLFLGAVATGCGGAVGVRHAATAAPVTAVPDRAARVEAVESARASFRAAEAAGGEYADAYSFFMAKEYLELAEHELDGGDIRGVIYFAEKSRRHSAALAGKEGGVPE